MTLRDRVREEISALVVMHKGDFGITDKDIDQATDSILQAVREIVPKKKTNMWRTGNFQAHYTQVGKNKAIDLINAEIGKGVDDESR